MDAYIKRMEFIERRRAERDAQHEAEKEEHVVHRGMTKLGKFFFWGLIWLPLAVLSFYMYSSYRLVAEMDKSVLCQMIYSELDRQRKAE